MAFRVAQISDTHLSAAHPEFTANFAHLAEHLRAVRPDLVLHTGDVSAHGELAIDDLRFARAQMDGLGLDWLAVPGNHDVGNDTVLGGATPADAARLARWRETFGMDWHRRDIPGWRVIGLDTLITTAGLPESEAQFAFLEEALATADGRRIALFQHKPLCRDRLSDTEMTYWPVLPAARRRLLDLLAGHDVAFVASGHLHQWWDRGLCDGLRQIWAPAVAFVVGDTWQERWGGKPLGYVEHVLHADGGHECRLVEPAGLDRHDIGLMPAVYGPHAPLTEHA
ncbi:metallophosphoesterase family protein [Teichococcus aestuarii]|uniref:Serine/threonine protein phosphatase n=1 Tax=Teichococcus aestuarii TaxID=568898 RepID=A0A2U1V7L7_9PROT|nr:metallophosphoesterase [Pseudoroseomonas aestuarii]PWC29876.1 serine/threonine protein phosphatase [Pseudoroseomonas aestuarii]